MQRAIWALAFLAGGSALLATGCGDPKFSKTWSPFEDTVRNATAVEAQLIDVASAKVESDWWKWKTKGEPVTVDPATARQLADALLDEKSYYRGPPKACKPMPGVRVRFTRGSEVVSILFCLECSTIMIKSGERGGGDDYDPAKSGIVAAMKKIFPDNADIQAFK